MKGKIMKVVSVLFISLLLMACNDRQVGQLEEFTFRKTLESSLIDLCEEEKGCISAVKTQISGCMKESNWRQYLDDQDNETESNRFATEFYACLVDEEGNPYFVTNFE